MLVVMYKELEKHRREMNSPVGAEAPDTMLWMGSEGWMKLALTEGVRESILGGCTARCKDSGACGRKHVIRGDTCSVAGEGEISKLKAEGFFVDLEITFFKDHLFCSK